MSYDEVGPTALAAVADDAVALALRWHRDSMTAETRQERLDGRRLTDLVADPEGLAWAVRFVDEVVRPEDARVAATALARLRPGRARFLGPVDKAMVAAGRTLAPALPGVVVPLARARLRRLVGHLVVDARDPWLGRHLARQRGAGYRLNVNLLGEAVLGEREAERRAERVAALLRRSDVDYVSVKTSSIVSQLSLWDGPGSVRRIALRLRPILRAAAAHDPAKFVNMDMEEYHDLDLTLTAFESVLSEPEFLGLEAGIVLQAYLPDSVAALERLIGFAAERRGRGGAGIKVRVVKGANLAMEAVDAELHGWRLAPYDSKPDVDANYLRLIERALRADADGVLRLGVASHNLFDVAAAHLLASRRDASGRLDAEMLQGMAPAQARVVRADVGSMVLYTPIVAPADFDVAVSYLVRRLEENAEPQNFLHAMVHDRRGGERADPPMARQERWFRESVQAAASTPASRRRSPERTVGGAVFVNTCDSDPALPEVRAWAAEIVARAPGTPRAPLTTTAEVDEVVAVALAAAPAWAARPARERARLLRAAARELEGRRGDLVAAMCHEGGKTVEQADPEVSEAVDFALAYADGALGLAPGSPLLDGALPLPPRVTLVTPPWNFPVSIPMGGVLAALAAGSAVVVKPAPPVPRCAEIGVEALHAAGIPREVLQVVRTDEGEVGRHLVSHRGVDLVVLTGSIETARLFTSWRATRPGGARVHAETSGKNSLVITPAADPDLAVLDLVRSAFGHAGQKCSAASLGILVGPLARSRRFRRQLVDAVSSLRVGRPDDLGSVVGPVIEPPRGKLLRALTRLDAGERWLVEPRPLDADGRLWSPGLKDGVRPGSFFHLTEVFGPVLGLMSARSLDEAIDWQNGTRFGLTGGLHSLDPDEIAHWLDRVEVGNAYINRGITGAIVRRQPFGGWRDSSVGPGAKAGGPNYVASLCGWEPAGLPALRGGLLPRVGALAESLLPLAAGAGEQAWLEAAAASDAAAVEAEFGAARDVSGLMCESNVFRYRPLPQLVVHCADDARPVELARVLLAAAAAGTPARLSLSPGFTRGLRGLLAATGAGRALRDELEGRAGGPLPELLAQAPPGARVRALGDPAAAHAAARGRWEGHGDSGTHIEVLDSPVLANGRLELPTVLREQSVSRTRHRYGHVPPDPTP